MFDYYLHKPTSNFWLQNSCKIIIITCNDLIQGIHATFMLITRLNLIQQLNDRNLPFVRKNNMGQGVVAFSPAHVLSQQDVVFVNSRGHDGLPPPIEFIKKRKSGMNAHFFS